MTETLLPSLATSPSRTLKLRKLVWFTLGILGLVLTAVLVTPHFIDLGLFKRTYLPLLEETLGRQIDVGEVHLSLIPTPSIHLSKLTVSDSAAFTDNTFFSAQQIRLRLRFLPLLRGRFEITELVLDKPIFNLLKQPDGSFNYAEAAGKRTPAIQRREPKKKPEAAKPAQASAVPLVIPDRVRIQDGELNLLTKGSAPLNIKGIDLALREFSGGSPFPFRLAFNYPGLKTISLDGQLNYQEEKALLELRNNRLTIQDLTLPVEGSIASLATTPRVNLNLRSDEVDAKTLSQILAPLGLAPRDIDVSGPMGLNISVAGPVSSPVAQVRGLFKNVKVYSKRAAKGNVSGEIDVRVPFGGGPVTRRIQGNGNLMGLDGEVTNVDLIKKIQKITGMIGLSKDQRREVTTFQRLEADFTVRDGVADFSRIHMVNPQMEVNGNGTMTLEQPTVNLALSTTLSPQASAGVGRAKATAFFKDGQGRVVVPLKISGPVENPNVSLNTEKLADTALPRNVEKSLGAFFKGLLGKR
jgi:AsmA protein